MGTRLTGQLGLVACNGAKVVVYVANQNNGTVDVLAVMVGTYRDRFH